MRWTCPLLWRSFFDSFVIASSCYVLMGAPVCSAFDVLPADLKHATYKSVNVCYGL